MRLKAVMASVVGLLALSACAPAQLGTSVYSPIEAGVLGTVELEAGNTWFVAVTQDEERWGVSDAEITRLVDPFNINQGAKGKSPYNGLIVTSVEAPDGWRVGLQTANAVVEVAEKSTSGGRVNVRYFDWLELVFGVTVPANATGPRTIAVEIRNNANGRTARVPLIVTVKPKAAN